MKKTNMAIARGTYTVLGDDKKQILRNYYDKGMTSTGPGMRAVIEEAANKADVSFDKVKKWIGNEKRKRKASDVFTNDQDCPKSVKPKRCPNGYNIFCSTVMRSDECQGFTNPERLEFAVKKWNSLTPEESNVWKEKAKQFIETDVSQLTPKQRKYQISKTKKQLISQLSYLESLGCEASLLLLDMESEVHCLGTDKGLQYLTQNNGPIKFMEFFECNKTEKFSASDVATLFNSKYCEASGKPLARVPYLHGGFEVTGLPEGVPFKKPTAYGSNTIQAIMKNAEKIKFNIVPKEVGLTPSRGQETLTEAAKERLFKKIMDDHKIAGCLSRETRIFEQDLEVINLDLLANEFRLLVTDLSDHFEKDAMLSLISNYQSSLTHQGYVLPVYTDTEEPYWLFYFPGGSCEMESLHSQDKIWGYWLDKTSNLEYRLLLNRSSIVALNVVCYDGELGSLRLKTNISLCDGVSIVLPSDFDASILRCLKEQGFL